MCCRCHPAYQHVGTGAEKSAGAFIHNNPSESDIGIFRSPKPWNLTGSCQMDGFSRSPALEQEQYVRAKEKKKNYSVLSLLFAPESWVKACNPFAAHLYLFFSPTVQNEHNYTVMRGTMDWAFLLQHCRCQPSVRGWRAQSMHGLECKHSQLIKMQRRAWMLGCHVLWKTEGKGEVECVGVYRVVIVWRSININQMQWQPGKIPIHLEILIIPVLIRVTVISFIHTTHKK